MRKNVREAEEQGFRACKHGVPRYKNPLAGQEASAWTRGWNRAAEMMPGFELGSTLKRCVDGTCNCAMH